MRNLRTVGLVAFPVGFLALLLTAPSLVKPRPGGPLAPTPLGSTSTRPPGRTRTQSPVLELAPLDADEPIGYWVAPPLPGSGFRDGDEDLLRWALAAWSRASGGGLTFTEAAREDAVLRIHWVRAAGGRYGEARPIRIDGRRGAEVFVRPDTRGLGAEIHQTATEDPLFRDTVVYLTCVHELGHGVGLRHSRLYEDVMYFFGYGGDIPGFFRRYRELLESREDIGHNTGLSANDVRRLRELYEDPDG